MRSISCIDNVMGNVRGVSFSLFIKILAILYKNEEEELPVNELTLKYRVSKETFYKTLRFLEKYRLIRRKSISLNERGRGRIVVYMLNDRGKMFYEHCVKPYFGEVSLSSST